MATPSPPAGLPPAGLPEDPGRRRLLALGLLLAVLGVVGLGVIAPALDTMVEAAEHEDRQRSLLERLERASAQGPALRRELDGLDAELAAPDVLFRAPSASQAAALLQEAVRSILEAEAVAIESAQALPPAAEGPLLRIGLRVELRAGLEPLSRIVQAIEASRPHVVIREAMIAASGGGRPVGAAGAADRLAVRLDLQGLARVAEGEGRARAS
jgi:Tfp pilus assembly protein PilO